MLAEVIEETRKFAEKKAFSKNGFLCCSLGERTVLSLSTF